DNYRVEYRRRFLDGACHAGARALAANDAERALRYYHRAVAQVPADEEASRGLMRCYAALGDTNGVHKAYRVLARAVQDELGIPLAGPGAETRSLFRELTEGVASG
ncbi:MAG: bacterial transcriptional activator domain-containing protein, partial [Dehalococcoidia bacterium]|nr:bacterial transcriptional activator domain-containing protein [Dehalococcoidia bacterium]